MAMVLAATRAIVARFPARGIALTSGRIDAIPLDQVLESPCLAEALVENPDRMPVVITPIPVTDRVPVSGQVQIAIPGHGGAVYRCHV